MYKIYSDNILIHDGSSPDLDVHLINPVLKIADCTAGTFDFTIPPNNVGYNDISHMVSTLRIYERDILIWSGRVLTESQDFLKRSKIQAEGALAYLNDTNQPVATYRNTNINAFLAILLDAHNAKVSDSRKIYLGTVTVTDYDDDYVYQTNYNSTLEEIKINLLDRLNGHIRIRYTDNSTAPYLDYLAEYPNTSSQEIDFGYNLLDFTKNWDLSDLATVIIPRGKQYDEENEDGQKDYLTVADVNDGSIYVFNQNAYNTYGRIEQIVDFSDVEDAELLLELANLYIQVQQFDEMTLELNAVDMGKMMKPIPLYLEDSSNDIITDSNGNSITGWLLGISDLPYTNVSSFNLLDLVLCKSEPHGLNKYFPITEIEIPLDFADNATYTLGTKSNTTSMTKTVNSDNEILIKKINNLPSVTTILGLAKENASQILNQRTTGYITITEVSEHSQALIISPTQNYLDSLSRWMFNMNGLGFTQDGGETYDIAITMNGEIVANHVKTGILSDGTGLNYWNLNTGEFSLSYNTEFRNAVGQTLTIVDVNTLANTANTNAVNAGNAANTAHTEAITAALAQTSDANILNGTNTLSSIETSSEWADGTWSTANNTGTRQIIDIEGAPNPAIVVGVRLISDHEVGLSTDIVQRNVPLAENQVYTLSCYILGTGRIRMSVGNAISGHDMYITAYEDISTTVWKRVQMTFTTGTNNTYDADFDTKRMAGIANNLANVFFGNAGASGTTLTICGMHLNRGNTASAWSESDWDTQKQANDYTDESAEIIYMASVDYTDDKTTELRTYAEQYVEAISENDRSFTEDQRKALDESFTQAKVLSRLTNNFEARGLYLSNGQLLMNADYIRTGTLDAGIVKAGILTDRANVNKWNMTTGYLFTRNMEAINAKLDGVFECGNAYKTQLKDGRMIGYYQQRYVGSVDFTAVIYDNDREQTVRGMSLRGDGGIDIRTPCLSVRDRNDNGVSTVAYTGKTTFRAISEIHGGDGTVSWTRQQHGIHCVNGLVVSVW